MNNAFDMEGMAQEAQNLNVSGAVVAPTAYGGFGSFGQTLPQREQPKLDKKGRVYGQVVMCDRCRARNVTLYKVGERKYCKKCKQKIMEGE